MRTYRIARCIRYATCSSCVAAAIDTFGWTVRHEHTHKVVDEGFWPQGWRWEDAATHVVLDGDGDVLPNSSEATLLSGADLATNIDAAHPTGQAFLPGTMDTDGDGHGPTGDEEDWVLLRQKQDRPWPLGSADGQDWSKGGRRWAQ